MSYMVHYYAHSEIRISRKSWGNVFWTLVVVVVVVVVVVHITLRIWIW